MKNDKKVSGKGGRSQQPVHSFILFHKENVKLMIAGLIIMAVGFFLMAGGKSDNPNVFDAKAIYSFRRITLSPILIILGLVVEIFAIMKKPKEE